MNTGTRLGVAVLTAAMVAAVLRAPAHAQNVTPSTPRAADSTTKVTKFEMNVTPSPTFNGRCPVNLTFTAMIYVNHGPATVTYHWERSDGATGGDQTLQISAKYVSKEVKDPWKLGAPGDKPSVVWERVVVTGPNAKTSGRQTARVSCNKQ